MGQSALYSFLFHAVVFLLLFFGMPWFPQKPLEVVHVIPVEVMTVAQETMAPKPSLTPVKEDPKPEEKKPEPPKPEPEKPTPPPAPEPEPEPEPEEVKPEPTPEPTPKPDLKEPAPAPQPKPKPSPPQLKEKPKKKESPKEKAPEKKKKKETFDSILKNLEDFKESAEDSESPKSPDAPSPARQTGKTGDKLTISEMELLRTHFYKCWRMDSGAQRAENLSVRIRIQANPDGTIKDAQIVDKERLSDPYYRTAAEAALRAAKDPRCAKLPLSLDKYSLWKQMTLNFDPAFLLGG